MRELPRPWQDMSPDERADFLRLHQLDFEEACRELIRKRGPIPLGYFLFDAREQGPRLERIKDWPHDAGCHKAGCTCSPVVMRRIMEGL